MTARLKRRASESMKRQRDPVPADLAVLTKEITENWDSLISRDPYDEDSEWFYT